MTANEELVALQQALDKTDTLPDENFGTEEVTKDEIDQLLNALPEEKPSQEDMLAAFFERHIAQVKYLTNKLGSNALKRVLLNVAYGEFAPRAYAPSGKNAADERALAFHFNECVTKRGVLRLNEEIKRVEAQMAKEQEDLKTIEAQTNALLSEDAKQMLNELDNKVPLVEIKKEDTNGTN